jgi:hypothetical protein
VRSGPAAINPEPHCPAGAPAASPARAASARVPDMLCKDRRPACMRPATGLFGWARALWVRAQSRAAACPTRGCPLSARGRARRRQQGWPDRRAGANPVPKPRRGQPGQRPARVLQPNAGRPCGGRQVHEALRAAAAGHGRCAPAPRPPWSRHFGLPPLSAARGAHARGAFRAGAPPLGPICFCFCF